MEATMPQPSSNSNERDSVLAQLTELFGDCLPQPTIIKIAQEHNWELSECIENLIHYNSENDANTNKDSDDADILIESEELQQPTIPVQSIDFNENQSTIAKYTGAIRKTFPNLCTAYPWPPENHAQNGLPTGNVSRPKQPISSFLQNGTANQFTANSIGGALDDRRRNQDTVDIHPHFNPLVQEIRQGHRVMVVMRGAPGCGKSHLARRIVDETVNSDYESHIFSTDDFFFDKKQNRYVYNRDFLEAAHNANQSKVIQRSLNGWSPIIVDNTNIKLWEMVPYVREGVRNGYLIRILEPHTPWSKSAGKLAMRNKHGVPKKTIEQMLVNYEMASLGQFLELYKLSYTIAVPIQRNYPAMINYKSSVVNTANGMNASSKDAGHTAASYAAYESKNQRKRRPPSTFTQNQPLILANVVENNESATFQLAAEQLQGLNNQWAAFNPEQNAQSWETNSVPEPPRPSVDAPREQRTKSNQALNGIYDLLRNRNEEPSAEGASTKMDVQPTETEPPLEKHAKDCSNELDSFRQIRQIYPSIAVSYLWDLFEKCNGDGNWTMDILLKDEDTTKSYQLPTEESRLQDNFTCTCDSAPADDGHTFQEAVNAIPAELLLESPEAAQLPAAYQLSTKGSRRDRVETQTESEIRRQIEEQFAINDEQDSDHVKKIRGFRRGIQPGEASSSPLKANAACADEAAADPDDAMSDGDELIEVELGVELICQLDSVFGTDAFQRDHLKDMKTSVFMPRALGQQLYAIWMESLYNQMEEQRQKSIKDDEEFAKQLQSKAKYPKIVQQTAPNNLKDIMEMEYAWKAYQTDVDDWKRTTPQDLASKMTRAKLFEIFPNVNRETLVEVLAAHDNKFASTVEVLKDSLGSDIGDIMAVESQRLLKDVSKEIQTIEPAVDEAYASKKAIRALEAKKLGPEEAKRAALLDFEENRNMAMQHSHLKAECYAKAREAFQRHDGQVAYYYTNVANLHKNKIDLYNHKAANAIVEVHSYTQKNPDMLDLHYLHSDEAIECLDLFVDRQILQARGMPRNFKYVFVITGRGLHSVGGFATIKHKVKNRLKERNLSWAEVNPGLLKVRLQGISAFSKDV